MDLINSFYNLKVSLKNVLDKDFSHQPAQT